MEILLKKGDGAIAEERRRRWSTHLVKPIRLPEPKKPKIKVSSNRTICREK